MELLGLPEGENMRLEHSGNLFFPAFPNLGAQPGASLERSSSAGSNDALGSALTAVCVSGWIGGMLIFRISRFLGFGGFHTPPLNKFGAPAAVYFKKRSTRARSAPPAISESPPLGACLREKDGSQGINAPFCRGS